MTMHHRAIITGLVAALTFAVGIGVAPRPLSAQVGATTDIREQIEQLNDEVATKKKDIESLNQRISGYRNLIAEKRVESADLADQVALIESQIARSQLSIDVTKAEIQTLELEVASLDARIAEREADMARERALMAAMSRRLYQERFNRSAFEVVFAHATFSEFFDRLRKIADMQQGLHRAISEMKVIRAALAEERDMRSRSKDALAAKQLDLLEQRAELEDERSLKNAVLAESQESELRFRYLLAELQREQDEADQDIALLERTLREKIDVADRLGGGQTVLSWPVVPERGISAYFHDPEYPFRNVFEHPAIDIRAYQGTPVRAPAAGIVARAKDAGYGYSYVMLLHNNNTTTVFGHLSRIVAKEDTFVERGEIIGYSGGAPGTPGAGRLTTGPHLHFEVRVSGLPVDPLKYLLSI